mmetsp:Transcript_20556/g.30900  ORF Transcript_20556/g.30900 Transcript_20556/m.30900 type:complete len:348 (+) Transcript_20556:218-1261(+)
MAQYKASMERIHRDDANAETLFEISLEEPPDRNKYVVMLEKNASFLLMPVLPLLWCLLLVCTMNRPMLMSAYAMPLLGIFSASLANAVPVGGGIVFVPILALWGIELKLGTALAVATMTFGNGVFGFLSWLRKDPKSISWFVVPYAVVPAWFGATWTTFHPIFPSSGECRVFFALVCLKVSLLVARSIYINQYSNTSDNENNPSFSITGETISHVFNEDLYKIDRLPWRVCVSVVCSFAAGLILVAHIGIGNAMTTFLVCTYIWKLPPKQCMVTGILCGGWTSVVPFLLHLSVLGDVPIALWVMGLPGVYFGAQIAPWFHEQLGGINNVLTVFCGFLVLMALLLLTT